MNKLKIGALVALVSSVLMNVWLMTRPKPTPETIEVIKTVEKIVTVDRVVAQQSTKTVTKPDGTKEVTETRTVDISNTKESAKATESTKVKYPAKTKYSLGLQVGRELGLDLLNKSNLYRVEVGYRLGDTPIWATLTAGTDRVILLGLRLEF